MVLGLTSHNAALVTAGSAFHRILLPLCLSASPQISVILENSSWHLIHSLSPASEGWGFGGGDALSAPSWCSVSDETAGRGRAGCCWAPAGPRAAAGRRAGPAGPAAGRPSAAVCRGSSAGEKHGCACSCLKTASRSFLTRIRGLVGG